MLWPLAASLPVAAGAIYMTLGTPQALDPENLVAQSAPTAAQTQQPPDMQEVVAGIKEHLATTPDDALGWFMLGRAHLSLSEFQEAEAALRRSREIDDTNIDVSIRLADAIALNQGGSLLGEPAEIVEAALELQPDHPQGLWLHGMALNEAGDQHTAIETWQRLLPLLSNDPNSSQQVKQLIANASQEAGIEVEVGSVEVRVDVAAGLADDLPADMPVFVYAKAVSGPPMPLAVSRHTVGDLPLTVTLSDAQAMVETMKISDFTEVVVGARIAKSGNPVGQPGDLFVERSGVNTDEQETPLELTITETLR